MTLRKHGITGLRKEGGERVGEGGEGGGAAGRGMTGRRGAARAEVPARVGKVRGVGEGSWEKVRVERTMTAAATLW